MSRRGQPAVPGYPLPERIPAGAWASEAVPLPGPVSPGTPVTVSQQYGVTGQTDAFAAGTNGSLYVAWVVGQGTWASEAI